MAVAVTTGRPSASNRFHSRAVKPVFSDGHDTGIYSWDYFYTLGTKQDEMWRRYLERIVEAGASREAGREAPPQRPKCK